MSESIGLTRDGQIGVVLLNRPHVLNAFDLDMLKEFLAGMMSFATDDAVRGVVLSSGHAVAARLGALYLVCHCLRRAAVIHRDCDSRSCTG